MTLWHTFSVKVAGEILTGASLALIVTLTVVGWGRGIVVLPLFLLMCLGIGLWISGRRKNAPEFSVTPGSPVAAVPPGWYPATDGTGRVMWWDGSQWTDPPSGSATSG